MPKPEEYTVGWICALPTERVAAREFLDDEHDAPESRAVHDNNIYTLGKIGKHNVVIAGLPDGEYGTASAASVARDMLRSFPGIRIGLMVGIGGGVPTEENDIRLGDIVVSASRNGHSAVFQYDFGKAVQGQIYRTTRILDQPPTILRNAIGEIQAHHEARGHGIEEAIQIVLQKYKRLRKKYGRPVASSDRLYRSDFVHMNDKENCTTVCEADSSKRVARSERTDEDDNPAIHYGPIASANSLMKDAELRDMLSREKGVLCFEMEAAGLMNQFPCLVIRGICDYSDSHKNKDWQGYAAMTAAAYAKELLLRIPATQIEAEKNIREVLDKGQYSFDPLCILKSKRI